MTSASNPWADHFALSLSDAELDRRVGVAVIPVTGLSKLPPDEARAALERTFRNVVVPTAQMRSTLRRLASVARSFASQRYPDKQAFIRLAYQAAPVDFALPVICLTGLSGVGKSEINKAFRRLFPPGASIDLPDHSAFPLVGSWHFSFSGFSGISKLLTQNFRDPSVQRSKAAAVKASEEAVAQGISLIATDELQFLTQSSANTLAAKILLHLSSIGPPLVFTSNYSMLHRLLQRPQEERQRLLVAPIVIHPLAPISAEWKALVREVLKAAPELSEIRAVPDIERRLHSFTFGIARSLTLLLGIAYSHARRRRNDCQVRITDLDSAFGSLDYFATREDVKALTEGLLKPTKLRPDLACPLAGVDQEPVSSARVTPHPSLDEHARRSSEAALLSTLSKAEHAAYDGANRQQAGVTTERTRRQPRPPASVESLIDGAGKFAEARTKRRR